MVVGEHGVELPVGAEHREPGLRRRAVELQPSRVGGGTAVWLHPAGCPAAGLILKFQDPGGASGRYLLLQPTVPDLGALRARATPRRRLDPGVRAPRRADACTRQTEIRARVGVAELASAEQRVSGGSAHLDVAEARSRGQARSLSARSEGGGPGARRAARTAGLARRVAAPWSGGNSSNRCRAGSFVHG